MARPTTSPGWSGRSPRPCARWKSAAVGERIKYGNRGSVLSARPYPDDWPLLVAGALPGQVAQGWLHRAGCTGLVAQGWCVNGPPTGLSRVTSSDHAGEQSSADYPVTLIRAAAPAGSSR